MLKTTKVYLAALSMASALTFASQPAIAQLDMDDIDGGMSDVEVVLNLPDFSPGGPGPDFLPPPPEAGGGAIAFSMPLPPPGDVIAAMRDGFGAFGRGACPVGRGGPARCPMDFLSGDNALTDAQYEKLYQLRNSVMDQRGPKMLEIATAKRHLKDELTRESIDEKAVKKLQNQIISAKNDLTVLAYDSKLQMMQILTGAQRAELRKAMMQGPKARAGMPHMMMRKWMDRKGDGPGK